MRSNSFETMHRGGVRLTPDGPFSRRTLLKVAVVIALGGAAAAISRLGPPERNFPPLAPGNRPDGATPPPEAWAQKNMPEVTVFASPTAVSR